MLRFTQLYFELDESNRTLEKVAALERYFATAPPEDGCWGLWFLTGRRFPRGVNSTLLREWVSRESGLPLWLVEECYSSVGDGSEAAALLLPDPAEAGSTIALHRLVRERIEPLRALPEPDRYELVRETWGELDQRQRLVYHKLIAGGFRVGVAKTLVIRALANLAGIDAAVMAHRVAGDWDPEPGDYVRILSKEEVEDSNPARPYPFFLAYPLEGEPSTLGEIGDWQVEWKWDGIRAQLIRRQGQTILWSRGEELINERFPEVVEAAQALPDGTVLDGEILAWGEERPLPFAQLQRRITRKTAGPKIRKEIPAMFLCYDMLEWQGSDLRPVPLRGRREELEGALAGLGRGLPIRLSEIVRAGTWEELAARQGESRERGVEGFMLKRRASPYRVGRVKGDWWKWKVEPFTADCVLVYAQRGTGKRASLYTDYTFAVWTAERELVPVMKAYSGLTDAEIRQVDRWIRANTLESHGPVRIVKPERVMELAFEGIQESKRHKSGLAVRFPRILRIRDDKTVAEADTLEMLRGLRA